MSNLVLDSLEIKNFRAFKHLRIEKLGRVNLIVGKNNVGKTSVLEALRIYALGGEPATIGAILSERDELILEENETRHSSVNPFDFALAINNLFYDRWDSRRPHNVIVVGSAHDVENIVILDVVWPVFLQVNSSDNPDLIPKLSVGFGTNFPFVFPIDQNYYWDLFAQPSEVAKRYHLLYLGIDGLNSRHIALLWDLVALSDLEKDIIKALQVIASQVEAVSFVGRQGINKDRIPKVRLSNSSEPVPLRSMGEGMNRMLGVILALVNAKDGMLLIDEVDTGLHYSVLPDLWKLIFEVAHHLNVQVFATSHSKDCIEAFQQAADENTEEEGMLVRLEHRNGDVFPVIFDERKLNIATRERIEVR